MLIGYVFFFFKQKTAYEMRISDWSSDVCSSDLPRAVGDTLQDIEAITPELFGDNAHKIFKDIDSLLILACGTSYYAGLTAKYWIESIAKIPEIGKASCRERVCQYG